MSKPVHPIALFRLSVLGPLTSRGQLEHGEVKSIVNELASKNYNIPDDYAVLFVQGGASQQFGLIPMNFLQGGIADYIDTGAWACDEGTISLTLGGSCKTPKYVIPAKAGQKRAAR